MCVYIYMHRGLLCCSMIEFTMFLFVARYAMKGLGEVLADSINDVNYISADDVASISKLVCVRDNPLQ